MEHRLKPSITLGQIFGEATFYSPCVPPGACKWLTTDPAAQGTASGGLLTITGNMQTICHAGVSTPDTIQLLRDAGFSLPDNILRYSDADMYLKALRDLCREERKIAVQYVHKAYELDPGNYLIEPSVLSFLNNKTNLAGLVGAGNIPRRDIIALSELDSLYGNYTFPMVVKAATDDSSGGGVDVCICDRYDEFLLAKDYFSSCDTLIIEEYINIKRNLCLNYVINREGVIDYLGCAEQVSKADGKYNGNWIDPDIQAPEQAVALGTEIVRKGSHRGYWGFVGIDISVEEDGRIVFFDLNFRVNGSTRALLFAECIRSALGQPVIRLRTWTPPGIPYDRMLDIIYKAMGKGMLLPLCSYDPEAGGFPQSNSRLTGMIIGRSRDEVLEKERELASMGLE
jgi:hypothetical protein